MPPQQKNRYRNNESNRVIRGGRGKDQRAQDRHRNHHTEHEPMQRDRLQILDEVQLMFPSPAHDRKKHIEDQQRDSRSLPATEKLSQRHVRPGHRFCQQGKNRSRLPFSRNLSSRRRDRNDQRGRPDQEQANLLQIANDMVLIEKIDRTQNQRDQRRQNEQDIKIL